MTESSRSRNRDADRVSRFLAGDPAGFDELAREYGKPLYNFIKRFIGDPEASKDVFQETLLAALKSIESFETTRSFLPWLLGIAVNRCREEKRRKKALSLDDVPAPSGEPADGAKSPQDLAADRETALRVAGAVAALDDAHRAVFLLRIYGGFTYARIGEILNISEGTAKSRMHYALYNVRKILDVLAG